MKFIELDVSSDFVATVTLNRPPVVSAMVGY